MPVSLGTDRLLASGRLDGLRVGIVCNPASIDSALRHIADRLVETARPKGPPLHGVLLTAIFGPQHGFRSDVQENMIETGHARDALRRVPVYSLYSETREPTAEMLRDVDALVVDLQDVGRGSTPTSTRWRTVWQRRRSTASRPSSAIVPIR